MPRGDGTGPQGMGPMTGRAAGYCAGSPTPGFANPAPRMGMGFRRGAGFRGRAVGFGRGTGRGAGFGRGFGNFATGRGFSNFGRRVGFRGRATPFAQVPQQVPAQPQQQPSNQPVRPQQVPAQPQQQPQTQPTQSQQAPPQAPYPPAPQPVQQPQFTREQEIEMLEDHIGALGNEIAQIKERIKQLSQQSQ